MPVSPTIWLQEALANSGATAGNQNQARLVQCADGSFWVIWRDAFDAGVAIDPGADLVGQRYDVLGNPIGGLVRINPAGYTANNERDAELAADLSGSGFFTVFESADLADGDLVDIVLVKHGADGAVIGSPLVIAADPNGSGAPNNLANPDVAMASATNGLVVWERTNGAGDTDIRARFFDPVSNTPIGAAFTLADSSDDMTVPQVVALANGTYAVLWIDEYLGSSTQHDVAFKVIDQSGTTLASGTVTSGSGDETVGSIVALSGGGFVISWSDSTVESGNVYWARYDSVGVQQGGTQTVAAGANAQVENRLFALNDGGFGILWEDESAARINARVYTATGSPVGGTVMIDDALAVGGLGALTLGDGRTLIGFGQFDAGSASNDIRFDVLDARTEPNNPSAYLPDPMVIGTIDDDTIFALNIGDIVYGWDGDDFLIQSTHIAATLIGGEGNDWVLVNSPDANSFVDGGDGIDTLELGTAVAAAPFTVFLGVDVTVLPDVQSAVGFENFVFNGSGAGTIWDNTARNEITSGSGNDTIHVSGGGDTVLAGGGDDLLYIRGTALADGISADLGSGRNTVSFAAHSLTDAIYWSIAEGYHGTAGFGSVNWYVNGVTDYVGSESAADHVLGSAAANAISGDDGDDSLAGEGGADTLSGGNGNDTLDGGSGQDNLDGGAGNDLFIVNQAGEILVDSGGTDSVHSAVSWTLASGLEHLTLIGTATQATGNSLANILTGNSDDNVFYAGGGADTIIGGDGNDRLSGSTGRDSMDGGEGDDIFFTDDPFEFVDMTDSAGVDEVRTSVTNAFLPDFIERIRLQGTLLQAIGNDLANDLLGNGSANWLFAYGGDDNLYGYGGEDELRGGDGNDYLNGGGASDTLDGGNGDDVVRADLGNDRLYGGQGEDNLGGGDGNDSLTGGTERDIMQGNAGADYFYFHAGESGGFTTSTSDKILDFVLGEDRIVLSGIDAVQGGGDNAFNFIGTSAFSSAAGELRYSLMASVTFIEGDTDGDGLADFALTLDGTIALQSNAFFL